MELVRAAVRDKAAHGVLTREGVQTLLTVLMDLKMEKRNRHNDVDAVFTCHCSTSSNSIWGLTEACIGVIC